MDTKELVECQKKKTVLVAPLLVAIPKYIGLIAFFSISILTLKVRYTVSFDSHYPVIFI